MTQVPSQSSDISSEGREPGADEDLALRARHLVDHSQEIRVHISKFQLSKKIVEVVNFFKSLVKGFKKRLISLVCRNVSDLNVARNAFLVVLEDVGCGQLDLFVLQLSSADVEGGIPPARHVHHRLHDGGSIAEYLIDIVNIIPNKPAVIPLHERVLEMKKSIEMSEEAIPLLWQRDKMNERCVLHEGVVIDRLPLGTELFFRRVIYRGIREQTNVHPRSGREDNVVVKRFLCKNSQNKHR